MPNLWREARYGLRTLVRNPGFTAAAVIALALGIGANTAIFSVVNTVLLRPLPFRDPDRLVWIWGEDLRRNIPSHCFLYADFVDWSKQQQSFEATAAHWPLSVNLGRAGKSEQPERVNLWRVNSGFFAMLGVAPRLGRDFTEADDRPGAPRVAILTH